MHYLRMLSGVFGEPDTYGIGVSVEQCVVSLKMTLISPGSWGMGLRMMPGLRWGFWDE